MHQFRTHSCNELNKDHIDQTVKLSGWVNGKRDHGDLLFLDIRDHYGITQCVVESGSNKHVDEFARIKLESVVTIEGKIVARSSNAANKNLPTGEIEVVISKLIIESAAEQIPFQVNDNENYPEDLRLKYRFLDLRRKEIHDNIILRSEIIAYLRTQMQEQKFLEIQTPILTASSPEGARDFLVPSRLHPGKFYALPQAPQQFKQLLMASGFDKYFQIAPCFRDEDARADRSPGEFYQLDMEMAFATQEDVFNVIEPLLKNTFEKFSNKKVIVNEDGTFPRISYHDAMLKYGCDKPDLRNPIIISDVTEIFAESEFTIFANNIKKGSVVRAIPAPNCADKPRSFFDKMIEFAIKEGAGGLAYIIFCADGTVKSPIAKFLTEEQLAELKKLANLNDGDGVFFACDKANKAANIAGKVRTQIAQQLEIIEQDVFKFCWVVDYPFYELDEETGKIDFSHNPFSMPQGGMAALDKDPLDILAYQYDVVCNGVELSSGAIRNHKPEIMYKAFDIAGYDAKTVDDKFGGVIRAFKFGAPPHGGIAPGIDRMVMLIADTLNIREVIAFPMNGTAQDLLMNAPNIVDEKQLKELNIELSKNALKILSGDDK
jgi:aspartyl-tRNA synthetase